MVDQHVNSSDKKCVTEDSKAQNHILILRNDVVWLLTKSNIIQ